MKNTFYVGVILLLLGLIFLMINFNFNITELKNEISYENIIRDKKIEELEKEIRILKTDIDIMQYGFEEK